MIKKCNYRGCSNTKGLVIISSRVNVSGEKVNYYMCGECNKRRKYKWYHRDAKNKELVMMANLRSLAKHFGYQLVKMEDDE